jgi:hypothetical protein
MKSVQSRAFEALKSLSVLHKVWIRNRVPLDHLVIRILLKIVTNRSMAECAARV